MNKLKPFCFSLKMYCLILLLSGNFAFTQSEISGVLLDSTQNPIAFANVILKTSDTKIIVTYTATNSEGYYFLKTEKTGHFGLEFIALSYQKKSIPITLEIQQNKIINATLAYEPVSLNEIILHTEAAIKKRLDTTTFKASAFTKGNEQVVEDLLKNIPGVTVEEDGTIKVGNKAIEKVMVDGDDFFEKGYKLLTKNLNADAVENVQVYERYSNNKLLKGIEESERVALNLTLKEGNKQQWFGNMSLGYGVTTENTYAVRTNLMSFGKKAKYYFLGNLNNVGTDATGDLNSLIRSSSIAEPGGVGSAENAKSLLRLNSSGPRIQRSKFNFNNTELASINGIFTLSNKLKLKTQGLFNWDENKFFRNSVREFQVENQSFINTEDFKMHKNIFTGFGKIDFNFDISKTKTLEYTGKFNASTNTTNADLLFNTTPTIERLKEQNELIDHKLTFTNKLEDTKVLLTTARVISEKTPQYYNNSQFLFAELFPDAGQVEGVSQTSENKLFFAGTETHFLSRYKNGNLLEIQAGQTYRKDRLITRFSFFENETEQFPIGYSNNLTYEVLDFYSKINYLYKYRNINFITQLAAHQLFNKLNTQEESQNQSPFYVNPMVGFNWKINGKNKITSQYRYTSTNSNLEQVYPNLVLTSFRNFSSGTNDFNPLNKSSVFVEYTLGNWGDKFYAVTSLNYSKDNDFFSTQSQITPDFSVSEIVKFSGRENISASTTIDRYIKPISSNIKLNIAVTNATFKNSVNNVFRDINSLFSRYGMEVRSGFLGSFNFHLGSNWLKSEIKSNNFSFNSTRNTSFLDITVNINKHLNFYLQNERYYFKELERTNNTYYFSDFTARYTPNNKKLNFMLSGQNLLNTKTFRDVYINEITSSTTKYSLRERTILLSVDFRF